MGYNQAMSEDRNIIAEWRESAPYWEKHAATVRQLFAPISAALIQAARITSGQQVLDIAGGTGEPALEIARLAAPRGRVVCTDAVAEMVAAAARRAEQSGIANIEFKQCAADRLPFADETFDAVVSRLGAMFFDDTLASLREMLRVLKPGGTIALAVWSGQAANPFFSIITDILAAYIASPPEAPDAPGAFRFAERGKLAGLLKQAGAVNVKEQVFDFHIEAALTPAEFWQLRSEISDSLRAKVARLTPDELTQVKQQVAERLQPHYDAGRLLMPAQIIITSGNRTQ
ncbi:MAG TPA: class I SAM-dependent methyltransferase [Blastocatellia bacterium]|nr:class I SAM-dependent methyltransferase [Blastocatellia bacterium]